MRAACRRAISRTIRKRSHCVGNRRRTINPPNGPKFDTRRVKVPARAGVRTCRGGGGVDDGAGAVTGVGRGTAG